MPGMTLCGEAHSFAHDQDLQGFCPNDQNEPAGDDFETRCRVRQEGRWFDSRDPKGEIQLDEDENDDEEGEGGDDEIRGVYERFCVMPRSEQDRFIAETKLHICALIGVSFAIWEPSEEFILEVIKDETPDTMVLEMAYASYLATPLPFDDTPFDGNSSDEKPGLDESADLIHIGQGSRERGLPNIGYRFSNHGHAVSRRDGMNEESHCPKYGRQDFRHQESRLEAKRERRIAEYETLLEVGHREMFDELFDGEMEKLSEQFDFSEDHLFLLDLETNAKMEDMARSFGYAIDEPCDILGRPGYMPGDYQRRDYYGYGPSQFALGGHDSFGDYYDDLRFDDWGDDQYDCPTGESEPQHFIDRFGDDDMGIFEGYGGSDADVDLIQISHSSGKRRTYHFCELMERRAELI